MLSFNQHPPPNRTSESARSRSSRESPGARSLSACPPPTPPTGRFKQQNRSCVPGVTASKFTPKPTTYGRAGRQAREASRRSTCPPATAGPDARQSRESRAEEPAWPLSAAAMEVCCEPVGFTQKRGWVGAPWRETIHALCTQLSPKDMHGSSHSSMTRTATRNTRESRGGLEETRRLESPGKKLRHTSSTP